MSGENEEVRRAEREAANLLAETGMGCPITSPSILIDLLAMAYLRGGRDAMELAKAIVQS